MPQRLNLQWNLRNVGKIYPHSAEVLTVQAICVLYSFSHPRTGLLTIKRGWKHFHCKRTCIKGYQHLGIHLRNILRARLTDLHMHHSYRPNWGLEEELRMPLSNMSAVYKCLLVETINYDLHGLCRRSQKYG